MTQSLLCLYANRCPLTKLIVSRYIARARRDAKMTCQALKIQKVPKQMSHFLNKNLIEYFGNEPYHYAPNKTSKLYIPITINSAQLVYLGQSYEIKLPPRVILGFKILEIFSVEN
jgi:hypothetical protein